MRTALLLLASLHTILCSCPNGFALVREGECRGRVTSMGVINNVAVDTDISKCKEIDGKPVIIHDDEEQSYWKDMPNTSNTKNLILGLLCNGTSNKWKWSDGSALDYKPATYNEALDNECKPGCVWFLQNRNPGDWNILCDAAVGSYDIWCTTQLQQPDRASDGCESFDDDSVDGVCYKIGETLENWTDGQFICRSFGAELASIHNLQENSFVRRLAVSKLKIDSIYLGATPSGKDDCFVWTDGSAWDYDHFYPGIPGFPNRELGDCVAMDIEGTSGYWANVDCSFKKNFACVRQQNYTASMECNPGPWNEGDIIYSPGFPFNASIPCDYLLTVEAGKKVQVEILLLEANSCCDHLLIFENYMGATVIANLTGEVNDKTYTSINSNFARVSWQPNGSVNVRGMMGKRAVALCSRSFASEIAEHSEAQPPVGAFGERVADRIEATERRWGVTTLTSQESIRMLRLLVFFVLLHVARCSCPDGFELIRDGQCRGLYATVKVHDSDAVQTAIDKCKEIEAVPAVIIHNDEDQAYWRNKEKESDIVILMGLTCNLQSRKWEWADGTQVDYKPYSYHEGLDATCSPGSAWYLNNDAWSEWYDYELDTFDIYCASQTHQPVPSSDGCLGFDDDSEDGVCYQVAEAAQNWHDAQKTCSKLGANLASIHNYTENSFIRRLAVSNGAVNGLFLGATIKNASFNWTDGTQWDYQNFYPGFPMKNSGDCLAMDTSSSTGQWMNFDCSAKLPVACVREKKEAGEVPEATCNTGPYEEGALITSPGFPYNASVPCNFFLSVDEGKKVQVEINFLEANSCCDFVVIYDAFLGGNQIANVTGIVHNATYTSQTNVMKVSWQPNGGVNVQGLAMTYRAV